MQPDCCCSFCGLLLIIKNVVYLHLCSVESPLTAIAPDRPFKKFSASKSGDRRTLFNSESSTNIFRGSEIVKRSVGYIGRKLIFSRRPWWYRGCRPFTIYSFGLKVDLGKAFSSYSIPFYQGISIYGFLQQPSIIYVEQFREYTYLLVHRLLRI